MIQLDIKETKMAFELVEFARDEGQAKPETIELEKNLKKQMKVAESERESNIKSYQNDLDFWKAKNLDNASDADKINAAYMIPWLEEKIKNLKNR